MPDSLVSLRARAEQELRAYAERRRYGAITPEMAQCLLAALEAAERERDENREEADVLIEHGQSLIARAEAAEARLLAAQQALREAGEALLDAAQGWPEDNLYERAGKAALAAIPLESVPSELVGRVPAQEDKP